MELLKGIKIIDFTRLLPGPLATHILAQMGAEVIKIESPKRMDYARFIGPQIDGASTLFHQLNHNKESLVLDYNTEEGKEKIIALIKEADVVIEQFRPGAMAAWGLGYEALKLLNPKLIYLSLTGYPQDGDYSAEAGHDFNYLAYTGMMSFLKDGQGKPVVPDMQLADICGSYTAIIALQGAIIQQLKTGEGCYLNASLSQAVTPFLAIPYSLHTGNMDHRIFSVINGNTTVNYSPYECADGKWISLAAMEIKFWNNFCEVVGKEEWKRSGEMELFNHQFDKNLVADLFRTKTRHEWTNTFKGHDVCVAPILEVEELEDHPFHQSNQTFEKITTPNGDQLKTVALPFKIIK